MQTGTIEEGIQYLINKIAYVYSDKIFIVFNNTGVTYIPENLLPETTLDAIIHQLKKTKANKNVIHTSNQQNNSRNVQLQGTSTQDEERINELKNQVRLRRSIAECCGDPRELELYRLCNMVRQRKNRVAKKINNTVNQIPQYSNVSNNLVGGNQISQYSNASNNLVGGNQISQYSNVYNNLVGGNQMNNFTGLSIIQPNNTINPHSPNTTTSNIILSNNNGSSLINLQSDKISTITEILSMPIEPKRSLTRRIMIKEQMEIIEFNRRDDSIGIPGSMLTNAINLYEKLRKDDDTGLRLALRDEELLNELEIKLKKCKFI